MIFDGMYNMINYKNTLIQKILILFVILFIFSCDKVNDPVEPEVSIDEKIGQMLLIGFRGYSVSQESEIIKDIKLGRIGGVVLYDRDVALASDQRNIQSPEQVKSLVKYLQDNAKVKLFISIDQEGGRVNRLKTKYGFPSTVSNQYLGTLNNQDSTTFYALRTATTLSSLGINLNYAPVVDLNINPLSPAIGKIERSFSANSSIVSKHSELVINAHKARRVLNSLKHFPGHGSADVDSHLGFTDVTATWSEKELEPYYYLINAGKANVIMTAHIFNSNLDPVYPATLSYNILTKLLRIKMKFTGVIISDDMNMGAISQHFGLETAIEKGINAGLDILLFANNISYDPEIAVKAKNIILKLIKEGKIAESRIDESYNRIMSLKRQLY